jgi:hypothetical protein
MNIMLPIPSAPARRGVFTMSAAAGAVRVFLHASHVRTVPAALASSSA